MQTRYRLRSRIGKGGMAEVFDAEAVGEDGVTRRVAVKRLIADAEDREGFARMFLDEARITSQLHHNNIVSLFDYGTLDGDPFQVLEFIDGRDAGKLRNYGRDHGDPMPVGVAVAICYEVARGLHYAHGATDAEGRPLGIVHRDVSPANVLVSWDGDVKLADFGIALAADREERTKTHVAKGKLAYMSPEQATAGVVDHRADIFSLGCTLHALVTGASPLRGESAMMRMLSGGGVELSPDLPPGIAKVVARALAHDRTKRFAHAGEMSEALGGLLSSHDVYDPRAAISSWCRRLREPAAESSTKARVDELMDVALFLDAADPVSRKYTTKAAIAKAPKVADVPSPSSSKGRWLLLPVACAVGLGVWYALPSDAGDNRDVTPIATASTAAELPEPVFVEDPEDEEDEVLIVPSPNEEEGADPEVPSEVPSEDPQQDPPQGESPTMGPNTAVIVSPVVEEAQVGTVFVPRPPGTTDHFYYVLNGVVQTQYLGQRLTVPVGTHRLSARGTEQELGPIEIQVLPTHTPSRALRPRLN